MPLKRGSTPPPPTPIWTCAHICLSFIKVFALSSNWLSWPLDFQAQSPFRADTTPSQFTVYTTSCVGPLSHLIWVWTSGPKRVLLFCLTQSMFSSFSFYTNSLFLKALMLICLFFGYKVLESLLNQMNGDLQLPHFFRILKFN